MNSTPRSVCIHGHFYQPPRESPWTGVIERQVSAAPFHNWNARIAAECYAPCLAAPILDADGAVLRRVNCWSHLSFDVGPTLMRWLNLHAKDVHDGIVAADRARVAERGFGGAMAQGYHHAILPLCSDEDRKTEIHWGLVDFEARFGRRAEGLWMPESAVSQATLCDLVDAGVQFVVLAPEQAEAIEGPQGWSHNLTGADCARAHRVELPGGRSMAAFFYDGPASRGVAFDGWLHNGERMGRQLSQGELGLTNLATDGESYGHHHRHGEMALAYAIQTLDGLDVPLTVYAEWLAAHPPQARAKVVENSSWSCSHGVGRWCRNCGCAMDGAHVGKHAWRQVVRDALNGLRDRIDTWCLPRLAEVGGDDPWALRNAYIHHVLATEGLVGPGAAAFAGDAAAPVRALLEVQRHRLMMFTSCGWFFDDPYGLETTQILRYAQRAIELVVEAGGPDFTGDFQSELTALPELEIHRAGVTGASA